MLRGAAGVPQARALLLDPLSREVRPTRLRAQKRVQTQFSYCSAA
jgi:hypothetical protein